LKKLKEDLLEKRKKTRTSNLRGKKHGKRGERGIRCLAVLFPGLGKKGRGKKVKRKGALGAVHTKIEMPYR